MKNLKVPEKTIKDKLLFKEWFINKYFQKFREIPDFKKYDFRNMKKSLKDQEKERQIEEIAKYFKAVVEIVSIALFNDNLTDQAFIKGRKKQVNLLRKIALFIMCERLQYSKEITANAINLDRTTVIYHCKTISGYLEVDKVFRNQFDNIIKTLSESKLEVSNKIK